MQDKAVLIISQLHQNNSIIAQFLDSLNALIILDGFDELDNSTKKIVSKDISILSNSLHKSRVIMTSRTGYYTTELEPSISCEICSLDNDRIIKFVFNWFDNVIKSERFLEEFKSNPIRHTFVKPLTLAHLCALYERDLELPQELKFLYDKIINLLVSEWDTGRGFKRTAYYSGLSSSKQISFLKNFAYYLTSNFEVPSFEKWQIDDAYSNLYKKFGLPEDGGKDFW